MRISVAMATYNGQRFIREQLDSLTRQTHPPDELVVSDDCSSDRTFQMLTEFARSAPFPVRIYRNDRNLGYGSNFLHAAQLCAGDWIAYCDQDDVWLPGKLATIARYAKQWDRQVVMVAHSANVVDETLLPTGVRHPDIRRLRRCNGEQLPGLWELPGFALTFRADLIQRFPPRNRGPESSIPLIPLSHDGWTCRLARILGDIVLLPDTLALYRRHAGTVTSTLHGEKRQIRNSRRIRSVIVNALATSGTREYKARSRAVRHQASVCGLLGRLEERGEWRQKLLHAEHYFSGVADWLRMRAHLYSQRRFLRRIRVLFWLMRRRGYTKYLGMRALLKDLFIVVVGGRRFRMHGIGVDGNADRIDFR